MFWVLEKLRPDSMEINYIFMFSNILEKGITLFSHHFSQFNPHYSNLSQVPLPYWQICEQTFTKCVIRPFYPTVTINEIFKVYWKMPTHF